MQPREWTPPALEPRRSRSAALKAGAAPAPRTEWGAVHYAVSFVFYILFYSVIAGLVRSRFPIDLGLFLFFTNEELIEWALRKVGIRLVPDTLGATFVGAFVWVTGASMLFARWKDNMPTWLASVFPLHAPWSFIAAAALGCAVLKVTATLFVRRVLPWGGIELTRDSLARTLVEGLTGFALLGLSMLLLSTLG